MRAGLPFRVPLLLGVSIAVSCHTFGAENSDPKSILELQTAIEAVLKETGTPGAGIAVVSRDQVEWVAGLGKADVAANIPAAADTLFRIGSVSKGFAALAALQLQEEGKLRLTDTVKQWVPDVAFTNPWEATDPVRLVHLMEHTAGFDDTHLNEYALNDPNISLKDALAIGAASRVSRWRPGSRMSYSNSGPAVLAAIIENVSGQHFENYVQEHFFKPLHMDTATYFYTPEVEQRLTRLYHPDGITTYPYWHLWFRPTGSINASPKDMANYVRFYLQRGSLDGTQLLSAASIERMETAETLPSAKLGRMAQYGLYTDTTTEGPFVFHGHNGGMDGALTEMAYLAEGGRGYAFMINARSSAAVGRIRKLIRRYITRDLTPPALPSTAVVLPEVRLHYTGYYQDISPRTRMFYPVERLIHIVKLSFADRALSVAYLRHRETWMPVSDRLFRKRDESIARIALLPNADGEVRIQWDTGTFKKVSALRVWGQATAISAIALLMLSSVLFAPIWGARKVFGKLKSAGPLSVRTLPLLGVILLIAFLGFFWSNRDEGPLVGARSPRSLGIMLLSLAFPLAAAASLYVVWRQRSAPMNRFAYWHSVLVAIAMAVVAVYLGYWGWIGVRLWA